MRTMFLAHQEAACASMRHECPAMGCMLQDYHPECRDGRCVAVKGPF